MRERVERIPDVSTAQDLRPTLVASFVWAALVWWLAEALSSVH
jgi:hypothetical protein